MAAIADQNPKPPNAAQAVRLALFLATANANASDETIEAAAKIADNLALLFGVAVIVGVAAEYLIPAFGYVALGNWPGAAVAIGVAGEIIFARRGSKLSSVVSDRLRDRLAVAERRTKEAADRAFTASVRASAAQTATGEATRELAKATERLAEAEEQLADAKRQLSRLLAQRQIPSPSRDRFIDVVSKHAGIFVNVIPIWDTKEAHLFGSNLAELLCFGLWKGGSPPRQGNLTPAFLQGGGFPGWSVIVGDGVSIRRESGNLAQEAFANDLKALLDAEEIEARIVDDPGASVLTVLIGAIPPP